MTLVGGLAGASPGTASLAVQLAGSAVQAAALTRADLAMAAEDPAGWPQGQGTGNARRPWGWISDSGSVPAVAGGLALLSALDPAAAGAAARAGVGALVAVGVAKLLVGRARPTQAAGPDAFGGPSQAWGGVRRPLRHGWTAMPSGHAALGFAVAGALAARWPLAAPLAYAWAASVSLSRVQLGEHWPTDAWVGARLGLAVASF